MWVSGLELNQCLSEKQTGKTLIILLLQKQSDLGLHCLYRLFWQAAYVQIFRIFLYYFVAYGKDWTGPADDAVYLYTLSTG